MHLLAPDHDAALRDPLTWRDNPFVRREWQRDRKRKQPLKALAWMSAFLLILCGLAFWGLWAIVARTKTVPWFLGGDLGTAMCALIAGIHVYYVMGASTKHTLMLFTQEAAAQTLSHLLLLPITPFQLLLQTMVYPWLAAMRTALFLLPVYVFCVGLGGLSWGDLLMLYVVFGLVSLSIPVWRRPALSDAVASGQVLPQPQQANATQTNAAFGATGQTTATGTTGQANAGASGGWSVMIVVAVMMGFFMAMSSGRGFGSWYTTVKEYIPDSILILLPSIMLSWPLVMARALVTPFDWYGWGIIPLPFILLSILAARYLTLVRTSEYLQVGTFRDLALLPTYLPRRKWEAIVRVVNFFLILGYLWKWLIWRGGLSFVAGSSTSGLAGFLFILLLIAIWQTLWRAGMVGRWLRSTKVPENANVLGKLDSGTLLRFLLLPVGQALGLFFLCCLVGRTSPFSMEIFALGSKMLAIGFAGALLALGSNAILGIFCWLGLGILPLVGYDPTYKWLLPFSPTYALFNVSKIAPRSLTNGVAYAVDWQQSALYLILPGSLLTILALILRRRTARRATPLPEGMLQLDPTLYGMEVWLDATTTTAAAGAKTDSPLSQRMVQAIGRVWDNAVAIKELRVGWRGKFTLSSIRNTLLLYAIISAAFLLGMPIVPEAIGRGLATTLMGSFPEPAVRLADILACWFIPPYFLAAGMGLSLFLAYAGERDKSTLGFLLMTPMRPMSIVLGKIGGMMAGAGAAFSLMAAWTLFLATLLSVMSGRVSPLIAWAEIHAVALLGALTLGLMCLTFASIFWKAARPAMFGWLWAIGIQVIIQSTNIFRFVFRSAREWMDFDSTTCVLAVSAYLLFMSLLFGLCVWGIRRMRKGDIAFATKRDN